ncbi:hypothetical protein B0H16DRAFT_1724568 [Mycena metata]|uniref:F-box domain-containing protein n=1 Tax=Mycena metata TaxID=1033252 RepID=A0AAD7IXI3_9AGAR|nr:hypothetical protein B0H16DRAFT_1724568 [Mycena metata]
MTTIQDIWDQIISCLDDSQQDLRSCALVSRPWTARAQFHLFRRVVIPGPNFFNPEANAPNPCGRLGQILSGSPHLIPFIRILDVPFTTEVLAQICAMGLIHLEVICFELGFSHTTTIEADSVPNPIVGSLTVLTVAVQLDFEPTIALTWVLTSEVLGTTQTNTG